MAQKQVAALVKIQIPAGQASPAPPVGTALGPHGVAIMDFCKEYNAKTEDKSCLLYTSTSPPDGLLSRMPSSA